MVFVSTSFCPVYLDEMSVLHTIYMVGVSIFLIFETGRSVTLAVQLG